ncbi:MAG: hypothetical protein ABEJ35_00795 [Halobacteriaceae archaeon]
MARAVAINVGANTNAPGVRGPVFPDGSAEFVPIPETEPTVEPPPTYAELELRTTVPEPSQPVHLDPEFAEYPHCERYSYGDPWGVKARPLRELAAGDWVFFYATLEPRGEGHPSWVLDEWGAYIIGRFRLAIDPVHGEAYTELPADTKARFANNAHVRRDPFDAAVLLAGEPDASGILDRVVPLSAGPGTAANAVVTALSDDSGEGPWWRRPLRFDAQSTARLRSVVARNPPVL